jgi:hypothetical protein
MPHALEHRLCWLIQQSGEDDDQVEFFTTIAQDIVNTLSWFAWYDWRIMLVGMHKAGCGMWLSFVDLPTLRLLPDVTDAMAISAPWHRVMTGPNQFVVSGGQAIMNLAAQGWRKALRNEAGTIPTLHSLASLYAQALEPKNSNIKLLLNWTNQMAFGRHYAETRLEGNMAMFLEKGVCDMGIAAKGNTRAIVGLKYDDDELDILEVENKSCNSNEVKLRGPKGNQKYVSNGPRVWVHGPIVDACDKKKYPWLIADAQPASDRSIYYDVMVIGSKTLKHQVKTRKIRTGGEKIPVVQPNPNWKEGHHNRYKVPGNPKLLVRKRFESSEPVLKCAKTKQVFRLNARGAYRRAREVDTSFFYLSEPQAGLS